MKTVTHYLVLSTLQTLSHTHTQLVEHGGVVGLIPILLKKCKSLGEKRQLKAIFLKIYIYRFYRTGLCLFLFLTIYVAIQCAGGTNWQLYDFEAICVA